MRAIFALVLACATTAAVSASGGPPASVGARAKGAQNIVVATVVDVRSRPDVSAFGDQLIVSDVLVHVDEALKGPFASSVTVTVEGGSLGDLTLHVSDMPEMKRGERAVFFLDRTPAGGNVPHGRGNGILKLDTANRVEDLNLTLAEVKQQIQAAGK